MRQQSVLVFAAAVAVLAAATSAEYPAGMGNWMRPEIEGLVASTEYDQHHVLYGQYDDDEGKWTKLSFTKEGGDSESPRVAAAEVFQNVDAPHKWELIKVRSLDARDAFFTVGFAEAAVTHERIFDLWFNSVRRQSMNYSKNERLTKFLNKQTSVLKEYPTDTPFGKTIRGIVRQIDGLWAGWEFAYKAAGSPAAMSGFTAHDMFMLSYQEDSFQAFLIMDETEDQSRRTAVQRRRRPTHCTAAARLINGDLHFGHATLTEYSEMIRQLKTYEFPEGRNVTLSSYPGMTFSADDYMLNGAGVHFMTTSLLDVSADNMMDTSPQKLPGFAALMATAYLAQSPSEAATMFGDQLTGTYPVMLLLTDTKKAYDAYKQNTTLPAGTFYVLEVAPGIQHSADMTSKLVADGHFLSFDVPFFPKIVEALGFNDFDGESRLYGDGFYANSTIAAAIRRDMPYIVNATTLFYAMRHNNYPHDPMYANPRCRNINPRYGDINCDNITLVGPNANNTMNSIGAAPRYDLAYDTVDEEKPSLQGGIDAKVQSVSMIYEQQGSIIAQNGPTFVQQKPFSFSGFAKQFPPPKGSPVPPLRGLPDTFNFPPGVLSPHASFAPKNQTQSSSGPSGGAPAGVAIAIGVVAVAAVVGAFVVVRQRRESRRLVGAGEGTNLL